MLVWFDEVTKKDVGLVGGKGANLGEMIAAGFPIPFGFILTAQAYFHFIDHNNLAARIKHILALLNYERPSELHEASRSLKKLILKAEIPKKILNQTVNYYDNLTSHEKSFYKKNSKIKTFISRVKSEYGPALVAVRSSATAEDLPGASFAGQQETFLNVQGENHLIQKIRECWASLFTERAIFYRHQQKYDHIKVGLAAVVQKMVASETSGIAFSIDPLTNDRKKIVIEAIFGLGEYIVGGKVTPDHYEVDKKTMSIVVREVKPQTVKYVKEGINNVEKRLSPQVGKRSKLSNNQIIALAHLVAKIEKHYFFPQDIEWAVEKNNIYIVQSRPITTLKSDLIKSSLTVEARQRKAKFLILKGDPASPGVATGMVAIVTNLHDLDKIKSGEILVAPQTNPDYVPAMKRAHAIVTETGGRTSHAAIVSRELGIPAVVGARGAIKILEKEKTITVDGASGEVYRGDIFSPIDFDRRNLSANLSAAPGPTIKTMTKIYVNLAEPENASRIAGTNVDGVGLLRAEFMMAQMGTHPKIYIKEGRKSEFVNQLSEGILTFAKSFAPRPVIYRASDFKTNEYRNLKGGRRFEPVEENPMIGYRGASRYLADPETFKMEIAAIKKVRSKGFKNIYLMIPFVRVPRELVEIKKILKEEELLDLPFFKLWIMVEVPSAVLLLEEFIKIGIDGVSVGTNDLTMLLLGVDRDNQEISYLYDEQSPAVSWALERIVKTCKKAGITCSVCGQAPSDYPEIVENLVKWGITSLSLNPDAVERTRAQVAEIEKKLWQR